MRILVTGASGVLGRRVALIATERGHDVVHGSRTLRDDPAWAQCDLSSGAGVSGAVSGADAVVHCATDSQKHHTVDVDGTAGLIEAAGTTHIVYPGIVGSDVIPMRYYRSKQAVERLLEQAATPHTIQRFTQFHQLVWIRVTSLARYPVVLVPKETRFQVIDPTAAAEALVTAVERGPSGRLADLGGSTAYGARDLARSVVTAVGMRRPVLAVNFPGLVGAAFRAGGNLTENRDRSGMTWNEFVRRRITQA